MAANRRSTRSPLKMVSPLVLRDEAGMLHGRYRQHQVLVGRAWEHSVRLGLIEAAAKGCFVEQSLKPGIVKHRLKVGGDWVAI